MYRDVRISNFRNIESLALGCLSRINLITGPNGAGKTALLEALFLNASACNTLSVSTISAQRGEVAAHVINDRPFRSLFRNLQPTSPIGIAATWQDTDGLSVDRALSIAAVRSPAIQGAMSRTEMLVSGLDLNFEAPGMKANGKLQWIAQSVDFPAQKAVGENLPQAQSASAVPRRATVFQLQSDSNQDGVISAYFVSPAPRSTANFTYESLVRAVRERRVGKIVEFVRLIDRRIKDLIPLSENRQDVIYVDVGDKELMPLTLMGNGFANALHIGCAVLYSGCRVFFIDEMEDGVYYLAFKDIAAAVIRLCQAEDLQMFITTHSGELAWAFAAAAEEASFTDISMLRLAGQPNAISAVTFDADDLRNSLHSRLDLR